MNCADVSFYICTKLFCHASSDRHTATAARSVYCCDGVMRAVRAERLPGNASTRAEICRQPVQCSTLYKLQTNTAAVRLRTHDRPTANRRRARGPGGSTYIGGRFASLGGGTEWLGLTGRRGAGGRCIAQQAPGLPAGKGWKLHRAANTDELAALFERQDFHAGLLQLQHTGSSNCTTWWGGSNLCNGLR